MDIGRTHIVYLGRTADDEREFEVEATWTLSGWNPLENDWAEYQLTSVDSFYDTTDVATVIEDADIRQAIFKVLDREGLDSDSRTELVVDALDQMRSEPR